MPDKNQIGRISHFFDKISVAVVELTDGLKAGDTIEIMTSEGPFQQKVDSMQSNHETVKEAKKGMSIGLKVEHPVNSGDIVFKA